MENQVNIEFMEAELRHWFKFDHLQPEQGIALLVGVVPDDGYYQFLNEFGDDPKSDRNMLHSGIPLINGDEVKTISDQYAAYERARYLILPLANNYHLLFRYWNSGKHPDYTPPSYYVKWAKSKGFIEFPSIFRLPKGVFHAISFS